MALPVGEMQNCQPWEKIGIKNQSYHFSSGARNYVGAEITCTSL